VVEQEEQLAEQMLVRRRISSKGFAMDFNFLFHVNYAAVMVAAIIFFIIGAVWFSVLFGTAWVQELQHHNIVIKEPSSQQMMIKMGLNFLKNLMLAFAVAGLVVLTGSTTVWSGLLLGALVGCGVAVPAMADIFIWESRSLKLFLIDASYQVIGIILAAIVLSVWR
jgi:hypothetical protein